MDNLIDTHCHLTDRRLAGQFEAVVKRAAAGGVVAMISAASDVADACVAADLAGRAANVYFTAGVHPHEAKSVAPDYLRQVETLTAGAKCVAIGEIGLDYHYDFSPRDAQRRVFAEQLALAGRLAKPVVIHTREAFDDTLAVIAESGIDGARIVFHSCTERPENVRRALDLGAMISFSGIVTFAKADDVRRSAAIVPEDRLLVETDSPYLSPEPLPRRGTNEPANVAHVAACLAKVRNAAPEALAAATTANAVRFFGLTN
jgi:TatD DNase family protein